MLAFHSPYSSLPVSRRGSHDALSSYPFSEASHANPAVGGRATSAGSSAAQLRPAAKPDNRDESPIRTTFSEDDLYAFSPVTSSGTTANASTSTAERPATKTRMTSAERKRGFQDLESMLADRGFFLGADSDEETDSEAEQGGRDERPGSGSATRDGSVPSGSTGRMDPLGGQRDEPFDWNRCHRTAVQLYAGQRQKEARKTLHKDLLA